MPKAGKPPSARRGEVWFAEVPGDKGRPVLVMTRDPMGRILSSVVCAPITSRVRDLSTEVRLGPGAGLAHASVANFDNTFLLSRSRLIRRLGSATAAEMSEACRAVREALAC